MSTVKHDFEPVAASTDAKEWAHRFALVAYLRPDFRHTLPDLEEMFEIAFAAARAEKPTAKAA